MLNRRLLCVALLVIFSSDAVAQDYRRAIIYYYDWEIATRGPLTIDDIRSKYFAKFEIVDAREVAKFANSLPIDDMETCLPFRKVNVRLVIDLYLSDETLVTFFASQFRLYGNDGSKSVEIAEDFKERFRLRGCQHDTASTTASGLRRDASQICE